MEYRVGTKVCQFRAVFGSKTFGRSVSVVCRTVVVSLCFEPSQPLEVASGLNAKSNLSLSYFAHKSFNTKHNITTAKFRYFSQKDK